MIMSNIPRRKIYEQLLIFEEGILEIERMNFTKENYEMFKEEFNTYVEKIKDSYLNIKALIVMFFENKQFEKEEDFEKELVYYVKDQKEINLFLKKNKNLTKDFFENCLNLESEFEKTKSENNKELLKLLDNFNSQIPKILEIRRDEMKK